jgi:hypothetical protein
MTDPLDPTNPRDPGEPAEPSRPPADETFSWTAEGDAAARAGGGGTADEGAASSGAPGAASTATAILEQLREAVDDLAERATPTVREFSARAAELAAVAADRAAPLARRAGEVTSEASGKLATRSRTWAADLRSSIETDEPSSGAEPRPATTAAEVTPPPAADAEGTSGDGPTPA